MCPKCNGRRCTTGARHDDTSTIRLTSYQVESCEDRAYRFFGRYVAMSIVYSSTWVPKYSSAFSSFRKTNPFRTASSMFFGTDYLEFVWDSTVVLYLVCSSK